MSKAHRLGITLQSQPVVLVETGPGVWALVLEPTRGEEPTRIEGLTTALLSKIVHVIGGEHG